MVKLIRTILHKLFSPIFKRELQRVIEYDKYSPQIKAVQVQMFHQYQMMAKLNQPLPSAMDTGVRIFSQFEEDGIILFILAVTGAHKKVFVDIGGGNCINSNCANLAINLGWHGLFLDGSQDDINMGREFYENHKDTYLYPPVFRCEMLTRENVNETIKEEGFEGEVGLVSIDIDGNDYWIWDALNVIDPKIVIVESHIEMGADNLVVPYKPDHVYPGNPPGYFGASPKAMISLGQKKGYKLVGINRYGFNLIFVKDDASSAKLPTLTLDEVLSHPRNKLHEEEFKHLKDLEYIEG